MKKLLFVLMVTLVAYGCSSSDSNEQQKEIVNDITSDYLCSTLYWVKEGTEEPNRTTYMFNRIFNDYTGVKYTDFANIKSKNGKSFTFKINAPYIDISFSDGSSERLKVYAITKDGDNGKHIYIDGSYYMAFFDGGNIK